MHEFIPDLLYCAVQFFHLSHLCIYSWPGIWIVLCLLLAFCSVCVNRHHWSKCLLKRFDFCNDVFLLLYILEHVSDQTKLPLLLCLPRIFGELFVFCVLFKKNFSRHFVELFLVFVFSVSGRVSCCLCVYLRVLQQTVKGNISKYLKVLIFSWSFSIIGEAYFFVCVLFLCCSVAMSLSRQSRFCNWFLTFRARLHPRVVMFLFLFFLIFI